MAERPVLPIDTFLPQIAASLRTHSSLIIVAEPGAGKSTRIPPYLAKTLKGKWWMLEPRRVATKLTAHRIAEEEEVNIGSFVGYQIRDESVFQADTQLLILTEALLTKTFMSNPLLEGIDGVILDEFHERSLHSDLGIALLKELQEVFRPELRIVVMSATIDAGRISQYLKDAPIIKVPGRTFPVTTQYSGSSSLTKDLGRELDRNVAKTVARLKESGDEEGILVFLPGIREIERCRNAILEYDRNIPVYPLHRKVPLKDQEKAISSRERGKVILSTNIAETSLTVSEIGTVIDTGLVKKIRFDSRSESETLELGFISKASAIQRQGRAGRVKAGKCIRLYPESTYQGFLDFDPPDLMRSDLAETLLWLASLGATNPAENFTWFEKPKASLLETADRWLKSALLLNEDGTLSELGKKVVKLPVHPRNAILLIRAKEAGHEAEATRWLLEHSREGELTSDRLRQIFSRIPRPADLRSLSWTRTLIDSYWDRLAIADRIQDRVAKCANGMRVRLSRGLNPLGEVWVCTRLNGETVEDAAFFSRATFDQEFKASFETVKSVEWSSERGAPIFKKGPGYRGFIFRTDQEGLDRTGEGKRLLAEQALPLLMDRWLPAGKETGRFLARLQFAQDAGVKFEFDPRDLLPLALEDGLMTLKILERANWEEYLDRIFHWELKKKLEEEAPSEIKLPGGRMAKIDYSEGRPKLAVRLQWLFGWRETPRLGTKKIPLLIEPLSPAGRPVQRTEDLKGFWSHGYSEVRKELRARYPKHKWPEDPYELFPEAD